MARLSPHTTKRRQRLLTEATRQFNLRWIAALVGLLTFLAYLLLKKILTDPIWANIAAAVVFSCWTYVILYVLFARRDPLITRMEYNKTNSGLVGFYLSHDEVDWSSIIRESRTLDIIVHFYDGWVRDHFDAFVDLFSKSGSVRLLMADPNAPLTLSAVQREFFSLLSEKDLQGHIQATADWLGTAFENAGSTKASYAVTYFPRALHYSTVVSDQRQLYLSVYEQFRNPRVKSQVFHLDLAENAALETYWLDQLDRFFQGGRVGSWSPKGAHSDGDGTTISRNL